MPSQQLRGCRSMPLALSAAESEVRRARVCQILRFPDAACKPVLDAHRPGAGESTRLPATHAAKIATSTLSRETFRRAVRQRKLDRRAHRSHLRGVALLRRGTGTIGIDLGSGLVRCFSDACTKSKLS